MDVLVLVISAPRKRNDLDIFKPVEERYSLLLLRAVSSVGVIPKCGTVDDCVGGRVGGVIVCRVHRIGHWNLLYHDCSTPVTPPTMALMVAPTPLPLRSSRRTGWNERETNCEGCHEC